MKCQNCGKENADHLEFCTGCGIPLTAAKPEPAAPVYQEAPAPVYQERPVMPDPTPVHVPVYDAYNYPPVHVPVRPESTIPPEYRPIGAWGYFGWKLLFGIPFVGFILLIVFACGASSNVHLKSFARSYFCELLIWTVVFTVLTLIFLSMGENFFEFLFYDLIDELF